MRRLLLICAFMALALAQEHSIVKRQSRRGGGFRRKTAARKIGDLTESESPDTKRVVCYYTNWAVYRKGLAKFTSENINPYLCTHLIYAFGGLTDDFNVKPFDSYEDIEQGGYSKFNSLKQYNKGMKTLLAIGGWNEGSARFSELVAYPETRENFTQSALRHLRRYNFDGLDLDWEYPASRDGSAPEDRENYAILCKELREAFEQEGARNKKGRLLLTMAVPAGQNYIDKGYDIPALNKYLDFFNILTYDYHSSYEPMAYHHAPIYPEPGTTEFENNYKLNIDWTIKYYLSKGAESHKLVMGIPSYGRSFTLSDGQFHEFGSSAIKPGIEGKYTKENGFMSFYEVCEAIASDGWEVRKPYPRRIGPYAFKGDQWVGYDDEHIVAKKAEYVKKNKLGGIMFWTIDSDDFRGNCNGKQYPLIEAGKLALFAPDENEETDTKGIQQSTKINQPTTALKKTNLGQRLSALLSPKSSPTIRPEPTTPRRRLPNRRQPTVAPNVDPLNTPEPPTTPSPSSGFKCKREGFFPNPTDCHKYFWCLDSNTEGLGVVAHNFNCPANLIFNTRVDGCDHPSASLKCKTDKGGRGPTKQKSETTPMPTTTEYSTVDYYEYDDYYYYDYDLPGNAIEDITNNDVRDSKLLLSSNTGNQLSTSVDPSEPIENNLGGRSRPQFNSNSRGAPQAQVDTQPEEEVRTLNRPQYTTIERERPVQQPSEVEEPKLDETTESSRGSLNYVTLSRSRPSTIEPEVEVEATSQPTLEYVTVNRVRSKTESPLNFNEIESSSQPILQYVTIRSERPKTIPTTQSSLSRDVFTTVPTPSTPSTSPPRIRVPTTTRRVQPITRPPFHSRSRARATTKKSSTTDAPETSTQASRSRSRSKLRNRTRVRVSVLESKDDINANTEIEAIETSSKPTLAEKLSKKIETDKIKSVSETTTERYVTLSRDRGTTEALREEQPTEVPSAQTTADPVFSNSPIETNDQPQGISVRPIGSPIVLNNPPPPKPSLPDTNAIIVSTLPPRSFKPTLSDVISNTTPTQIQQRRPRPTPIPVITSTPEPVSSRAPANIPRRRPSAGTRRIPTTTTRRPASNILDYDYDIVYYDDAGALSGALGQLADYSEKAILLPDGSVQCYDTGYFAHPKSCNKFIACSKNGQGLIGGWVYTCPIQLVFDPVGGRCNWAEAVDCIGTE